MVTITPVNVGTAPNDGTGDPLRTAYQKINTNESNLNAGKLEAPVSLGNIQDIASDTILGRDTPGSGPIGELTPAQVRTLLNVEDGAAADQNSVQVPFTPDGTISSTNTQAAVQEVRDEAPLISSEDTLAGQMQIATVNTLPGTPDSNTIYLVLT